MLSKLLGFFLPLLCLALLPICALAEGEVTFSLSPPAEGIGLMVTSRNTITKLRAINDNKEKVTIETVDKTKYYFSNTEKGTTITEICVAFTKKVNGNEVPNGCFDDARINLPISLEIDAKGEVTKVRGIDKLRERVRRLIESDGLIVIDEQISTETITTLIKFNWENTTGPFIGLVKKPGDAWEVTAKEVLFSTEMVKQTRQYSLEKVENVLNRPCAVIKMSLRPDPALATEDMHSMIEDMDIMPEGVEPEFLVDNISIESTYKFDPTLLMPLAESSVERLSFSVTVPGEDAAARVDYTKKTNSFAQLLKK